MHFLIVVHQTYEPRVIDEYVLRGNTAIVKCLIPSFVADYVQILEWIMNDGTSYTSSSSEEASPDDGMKARASPSCQSSYSFSFSFPCFLISKLTAVRKIFRISHNI